MTESPNTGYTFSGWSGDGTGTGTTTSVTITGHMSVTATFTPIQYTLTVTVAGAGCSVTKSPSQATYAYGTIVQLTPVAASGYAFTSWSGDLTGNANPGSITISGNNAVTATFSAGLSSPTISTFFTPATPGVGGTVHDSATLTGATATAGGSVTYTLKSGVSPGGTILGTDTVSVTNGVVPNSKEFSITSTGQYYFIAVYGGDTNNNPATSSPEPFTVSSTSATTTTALSSSSITLGETVTDTVTVTGSVGTPTGTVDFQVSTDGSTFAKFGATKTLASGSATSDAYMPLAAGTYYFRAVYSGDSAYSSSRSLDDVEQLTVNKATPTTTTLLSPSSITLGESVTDTVTVTGLGGSFPVPTGNVQFYWSTDHITWTLYDTKTLPTVQSASYTPLSAVNHWFKAFYNGDSNYIGSESGETDEPLTVNTVLTVSLTPTSWTMDMGQSKTFTATPSGGSGTYSSYQWYLDGSAVSGQTASTYTYTPTASGSHSITVTVTDSLGTTSAQSSSASVTVNTALSVSISPTSVTLDVGQSRTFTATASGGTTSYSYQWYLGGSVVSGQTSSTYTYTPTVSGSYTIYVKVTDSASTPVTAQSSSATVAVNTQLVAPTVTASPTSVTQGSSSSLTSTTVSTGTSPYTYQWLQKAPGASSYSSISGATSSTYSFATTTSTTTGAWSFELQVTDSASTPVTMTSAAVTVTVSAAATFVIDSNGSSSSTSSATVTVSSLNCASGDVVIVLASSSGSNTISSVSSGGLTWTLRTSVSQNGHDRIWEYYAVSTSTLTSVTVTFGSTDSSGLNVVVFGISGANTASPFDISAKTAYASTTGAPTVTGVTTSNAHDMIIGLEGHRSTTDATAGSIASTTGTLIKAQHSGSSGTAAEYRIVSTTVSSQSVAFGTVSTNDWAMIVEAIKAAS